MKRRKLTAAAALILALAFILGGCGGATSPKEEANKYSYTDEGYSYDTQDYAGQNSAADSAGGNSGIYTADPALKIIYTSNMSLETKDFDASYKAIESLISEYGGYISDVNSWGGYTYSDGSYAAKRAEITVRVPAENYRAFISAAGNAATVTSLNSYTEDVTSSYVDTSARVEALEAQKEQLMSYLKNAKSVTEMLEVQDRLYDVIYELESYQSRLNTYDGLIAYSTVYINLSDVSKTTLISRTFGEDFAEAVRNSWRSVVNFIQKIIIAIVWIIPYALVIGIIWFAVSAVVRVIRKKFPPTEEQLARREAKRARRAERRK